MPSATATLQTIEERTRAVSEVTDRLRPLIALAQQAPAFVVVVMDSFDEAVRTASDNGIDVERGRLNGASVAHNARQRLHRSPTRARSPDLQRGVVDRCS